MVFISSIQELNSGVTKPAHKILSFVSDFSRLQNLVDFIPISIMIYFLQFLVVKYALDFVSVVILYYVYNGRSRYSAFY